MAEPEQCPRCGAVPAEAVERCPICTESEQEHEHGV